MTLPAPSPTVVGDRSRRSPAGQPLIVAACVVTVGAFVAFAYATVDQFVLEGTDNADFAQWATRPLWIFSLAALLTGLLAALLCALRRRVSRVGVAALVVAMATLGLGVLTWQGREHPEGHERALAGRLVLPAGFVADRAYRPTVSVGGIPPELVRTWSAVTSATAACTQMSRAVAAVPSLDLVPDAALVGPSSGIACGWHGAPGGWPVLVEVDVPQSDGTYDFPTPAYPEPVAPVASGYVQVALWVQTPSYA